MLLKFIRSSLKMQHERGDYSCSIQANREILPLYIKVCFTPTFLPVRILVMPRRHSLEDPRYYAWHAGRIYPLILWKHLCHVTLHWKTCFRKNKNKKQKIKFPAKFLSKKMWIWKTNILISFIFLLNEREMKKRRGRNGIKRRKKIIFLLIYLCDANF